jgi:hypothetical protein
MPALARLLRLGALATLAATAVACGGSDDPAPATTAPATIAPSVTRSEAELALGLGLLSPDDSVVAAAPFPSGELPPDTAAAAEPDDTDLPPGS